MGVGFCASDFYGCTGVICFEEVTCVDVPAPGVGAMCGPCPVGYFRDDRNVTVSSVLSH